LAGLRSLTSAISTRFEQSGIETIRDEIFRLHIDVDLYNPEGGRFLFFKHQVEIRFNARYDREWSSDLLLALYGLGQVARRTSSTRFIRGGLSKRGRVRSELFQTFVPVQVR
jgi:hypothetical protein